MASAPAFQAGNASSILVNRSSYIGHRCESRTSGFGPEGGGALPPWPTNNTHQQESEHSNVYCVSMQCTFLINKNNGPYLDLTA